MFSSQYIAETVLALIGTSRRMIYFVIIEGEPGERNRERERERVKDRERARERQRKIEMVCASLEVKCYVRTVSEDTVTPGFSDPRSLKPRIN